MRVAFALAFSILALVSVISATETHTDATTPTPATKLRSEVNVAPPPQQKDALDRGERRLGFWDWLVKSPTAAPDTPPPETYNFGNNGNTDDDPLSGPFWDPNATF
ncbi:hypothetical protein PHYPSEUDO_004330 [Phytophthora pseudosyringae]|uniref:RxLR effector protein n=1 Tax=Phytophthora pseudosyringae TaxID=221518 RepID=A0A8T1VND5_9STRA|nr:hypothetical protein PHYPSEUDO_004330 [Phytophthora pseudosyringae]